MNCLNSVLFNLGLSVCENCKKCKNCSQCNCNQLNIFHSDKEEMRKKLIQNVKKPKKDGL